MKEFNILFNRIRIIFILTISIFALYNTYAQSAIQTQLGSTIKYIVAKDGSGNYITIQAAINAIPNNSTTSQVIFIKKGTYTEKVEIPSTKTHLVLIGEDVNTTIIVYGDYSGSGKIYNGIITSANGTVIGTSTSHTLYAAANDFAMMNITVANNAGDIGQAVALNSNADRQFYYHCKMTGHQDTYLTWASTRYYLKDCYIEGAVDFIFGAGIALFDSCQLNAIRNGISYTAASTNQNFKFGYVFNNCKLTANSGVTGIYLGRPWKAYCQVVFMNSEEPSALDPAGWSKWSGNTNDQTCYYAEYKNCGSGSSISNRAAWTNQLTASQAATYTRTNIFDKNVNPIPFAASWDPNPEGNIFYNIVNKNTNPFITSACFTPATTCSATITAAATSFCIGESVILTTNSGATYKWFNGTTQVGTAATYTATLAGAYTVEVTNASGCKTTSAPVTITINPLPIVTQYVQIGTGAWSSANTAAVCETNTVNLGPLPNLSAGWTWTGPNNFISTIRNPIFTNVTASNAGSYIATYIDPNGCKATSTFILQVSKPIASITTPTTSFCSGSSTVLTASIGSFYKWFNGTTQVGTAATYTATLAGAYTVEVTNASGCKTTSAVTQITVNPLLTASITTPTTSFCTGGSVILTSSTGASYKWFNGTIQVGTAATYTATSAGAYTVEVTNASGCKTTSAVTQITVNPLLTASITTPATSFCTGASVILTSSTGASYKWFNGTIQVGTESTYIASTSGAYTVEVTNANGCKATSATIQITVNALPTATITTPANSFCTGGSGILTSSTGASYKWFNGTTQVGTASAYTATTAGAYSVEVINASGCKGTSAVTQITVNALPTAIITAPATSFCTGSSTVLTASSGSSYKWFNGTTQVGTAATYTATTAGAYTVEVTNASGCKATSAITQITVNALPTASITAPATSFCTGGSVILTSSTGATYKWFNGTTQVGTTATYTATTAGAYSVEVTNASGCKATSAITQITSTTLITWYEDTDNDGMGDPAISKSSCTQPNGYVSVAGDACPTDPNKIDPGNCDCGKTETSCLDCAGTPNGTALFDNCNICVGGTTGNTACLSTATINGTTANITVIPQPFDANTRISINNLGMIQLLNIISASGAIVEAKQGLNTEEITLGDNLASGLYTVIITTEKGIYTTKIVKK
jgi:pectin methylesterase-like acyl-CoA thioesterase